MSAHIMWRDSGFHLIRRVPRRYEGVEKRRLIRLSLKTQDLKAARIKADQIWENLIEGWEAKLRGDTTDAEERFVAAKELAAVRGFRWMPAERIAKLPLDQLRERVEAVDKDDDLEAEAILGGAKEPEITISRALEIFFDQTKDERAKHDRNQKRMWINGRKRAAKRLMDAIGDIPISEIGADEALAFRDAMWELIQDGKIKSDTANREIGQISAMLNRVIELKRLNLGRPLAGIRFKAGKKKTRPAFSSDWIRDRILAPGALDTLNPEARAILLGMINTGYRPSEGFNLLPHHIRLDHEVPHIFITGEERDIKTDDSERAIPLVGVSLEAFRAFPNGFERYRGGIGPLALINKYLRNNGLMETDKHTLYGLRHSFEDRMLEAGVDERVRRDLMGHKLDRERYGEGGSLAFKRDALQAIAF